MYKTIPNELEHSIKQGNDIVEVVEGYVSLKKQGKNYFGLCPFHDEKSPSFSVAPDKQIFHCFGCGEGGNVISFIMAMESLTYIETIRFLAERKDIELPDNLQQHTKLSKEAENILSAYDWLTKYYHHLLKYTDGGKQAISYLSNRNLSSTSIDEFQLGYAPLNSDVTVDFLTNKGFHTQSLVKAGLVTTKDNQKFVDVYRGRVIFPIKNHLGKTVAFSGRALTDDGPKYYNSPEHELFQKGKLLFNFHLAKRAIRKNREAILFEGAMDVIQAYQSGVENGVATLGTAINTYQAKLLKRYVDRVIICYDSDNAGIEASFKAANILQEIGCGVAVIDLPDGYDPDQYIKEKGANSFNELIRTSDSYLRFYMRYKRKKYNMQSDSERIAYIEDITKELAKITSPIQREYYVKELAEEFNLSTDILYNDIEKHQKQNHSKFKDNNKQNSNTRNKQHQSIQKQNRPAFEVAERLLLSYMLQFPKTLEKVKDTLGIRFNIDEHIVILTHLYALYEANHEIDISKLINQLGDLHLKNIVSELAMMPLNESYSEHEINDYIRLVQREKQEVSELNRLRQKQKLESNPILAAKIGLEIIELEKQMKS